MPTTNQTIIQSWSTISTDDMDRFGEEGDFSRQHLLNPALLKLIGDPENKSILDAGCGTGYLSRMLAQNGAQVTGVEPADPLFRYALAKEYDFPLEITYVQEDLSSFHTDGQFDVVVANMVFMDIPDYEKAIKNCVAAVKVGGAFIFSLSHPCFEDDGDEWAEHQRVVVHEYFSEYNIKRKYGYSFHRPLSTYINCVIQLGCEIEEMVEPQLPENIASGSPKSMRDVHVPSFVVIKAIKK